MLATRFWLVDSLTLVAAICFPLSAAALECRTHEEDGAQWVIVADGSSEISRQAPAGSYDEDRLSCEPWEKEAVRVVLPSTSGTAYEMFVGISKEGSLVVAWDGMTGLEGDFGERWGWFLDAEPLSTGDSKSVPILYALHEQVRLCGHGMVPLFVKMYDPATASFRPVSFDRLRRAGEGWGYGAAPSAAKGGATTTSLVSSVSTGKASETRPVLDGFLRFSAASSTLGDLADPALVRAPLELGDGDPDVGWMEGTGGSGWGEFVTAHTADGRIPITSLALQLTRTGDGKQVKKLNRLKTLDIVLSGGQRFSVKVALDPAKHADRPVIVRFASPVLTECVSVIVRDVYPGSSQPGDTTYLGEVTAYTSLDSGDGILDLLEWFEDPQTASAAAKLLAHVSPAAAATIAAAYPGLGTASRQGVLEALSTSWDESVGLVAEAAARASALDDGVSEFAMLVDALTGLALGGDDASTAFIESWYEAKLDFALTVTAVAVLARTGHAKALGDLIASYMGNGEKTGDPHPIADLDTTGWIREGLKLAGEPGTAIMDDALATLDLSNEDDVHDALVLLYLVDYKTGGAPALDLAASWGALLWDRMPTLWCRHHVLPLAARLMMLGDARGVAIAAGAIREGAMEAPLRTEALAALGVAHETLAHEAWPVALEAMSDHHPGVRAAAASCLRQLSVKEPGIMTSAMEAARTDAWPEVRLASLRLLSMFDGIPVDVFHDLLRDPDSSVRKEAIRLVVDRRLATEEIAILLANTTVDPGMRTDVRVQAAHAIGSLCLVQMAMPLGNVVAYGIMPDSTDAQIQTAAAAADALGRLGDPGPLDKLIEATYPGLRLQIRLAAIQALGLIADPGASEVLEALSQSLDPAVAAAASAALELVGAGSSTAACVAK